MDEFFEGWIEGVEAKAENPLRTTAQFLEAVLDSLSTLVMVLDRDGHIVWFNRALERTTGYTRADRGRFVWEGYLAPESAAAARAAMERVRRGELTGRFEGELITRDGRRWHVVWSTTAISAGERIEYVVGTGTDVTEREELLARLQQALQERDRSAALLNNLFDAAPLAIAFLDSELRYVRVNPKLAALNRLPAEMHLGKTPKELLPHLEWMDESMEQWRRVIETGEPLLDVELKGTLVGTDGQTRVYLASFFPVDFDGRGLGVVIQDITERKRTEDFLQQLLGIVGHDLRNPLAAISVATELLLRRDPAPADRRLLERIASAARRATRLTYDVLDFTRARLGGGIPIHRVEGDFHQSVRQVVDEVRTSYPNAEILLVERGDGGGEWDSDRVAQLATNLLTNAVVYGAGSRIRVSTRGMDQEVILEVHNGGPPIPPARLERIFEPFKRAAGEEATSGRSVGLGLFVVNKIAEAHGGTVAIRSSAEEGTTVTVRLPRRSAAAQRDRARGEPSAVMPAS